MTQQYVQGDTRRQQIAAAALEILANSGLAELTTRAIASRVGITDGTIFRHFTDKNAIILAALDQLEAMMFASFPDDTLPPLVRLERFFRTRALLLGAGKSVARLIFSEQILHAAGPEGRGRVEGWQRANTAYVAACLNDLATAGQLDPRLPPEALLQIVKGMLLSYTLPEDQPTLSLTDRVQRDWSTLSYILSAR